MGIQEKVRRTVGARVRSRRKRLGLSLENLSLLSGATAATLSHIERGNRDVKLSTLVNIADALRVEVSSLFNEDLDVADSAPPRAEETAIGYNLGDD